ncbi:MAG: choice-of-anchor D domain-containing protein, partial [Bacteroidota bacterium]
YSEMRTTSDCNLARGVGSMSATIGIAASPSRFVSVSLASGSPVASTAAVDNNVNILSTRINSGDVYTFTPCSLQLTGRTGAGNGAPAAQVNNGDLFFTNFSTQIGNQAIYSPLTIKMTDPSCIRNYTLSISGPAASEYYFNNTPGTQVLNGSLANGSVDNPTITFRPTGTGVRTATLLITDAAGFSRTVTLNAQAPFVNYTGNIAQGAQSVAMNSGDTLFNQTAVNRFTFQNFQPFTLTNVSASAAAISYSITGPGAAQYTFATPPASSLAPGGTDAPTIRFAPVTFGRVVATLQVTAAGQTRTFPLNGISAAPGGTLIVNNLLLDSNTVLFNNQYSCVGGAPTSYPVTFTNVGYGPFNITGIEAYATDTTYGQGTPKYPNRRDAQGRLVPIYDYFISDQPLSAPPAPGTLPTFPITVGQGQTRTIYLNFIGQQPSKRFAQLYIRTNGQNLSGRDTNGVMTEGIFSFGVFARGQGAQLSDNVRGGLPNAVTFPSTKVGEVSKKIVMIANPGQCDLRISLSSLEIISGDAKEFIISKLPTTGIDPVTNDLIIPAGSSNSGIEITFAPMTGGARRAALVLRTNDSTVILLGHTKRGVYYLDLFGTSPMVLTASNLDLGSALIGGTAADQKRGVVYLENTANNPISITQVLISGADTADFKMDGSNAWPTLPKDLLPGERLDLGIVFAPGSGTPGPRTVKVRLVLSSGDTVDAIVTGVSGT